MERMGEGFDRPRAIALHRPGNRRAARILFAVLGAGSRHGGRIIEPGHQFEWAFLMLKSPWGARRRSNERPFG